MPEETFVSANTSIARERFVENSNGGRPRDPEELQTIRLDGDGQRKGYHDHNRHVDSGRERWLRSGEDCFMSDKIISSEDRMVD